MLLGNALWVALESYKTRISLCSQIVHCAGFLGSIAGLF